MSPWGPDHGAVSAGLALFFQEGGGPAAAVINKNLIYFFRGSDPR
jgi:hypothetical protein